MRLCLFMLVALALAACDQTEPPAPAPMATGVTENSAQSSARSAPVPAPAAALTAAGPASAVTADEDPGLQTAASVIRVDPLHLQGAMTVKLFGAGGGDPAMNGLQTSLAFFLSPAEGWKVFRVGDVLDYRVLSESPGRLDLELTESRLEPSDGSIGQAVRRVIVGWPLPADGAPPQTITITPAR